MGIYNGGLTGEPFLFYEMRITSKLMLLGLSNKEIIDRIAKDNLFQYPTERKIRTIASACIKRLHTIENDSLIKRIIDGDSKEAKQICLYAIIKYSRLMYDFMITVIGEKYKTKDFSFGRIDLNIFFMRLQEQDDDVSSWSDTTIEKIKQVITKILVENDYLDNRKANHLNLVWIYPMLENTIREKKETEMLCAFNCLEDYGEKY